MHYIRQSQQRRPSTRATSGGNGDDDHDSDYDSVEDHDGNDNVCDGDVHESGYEAHHQQDPQYQHSSYQNSQYYIIIWGV